MGAVGNVDTLYFSVNAENYWQELLPLLTRLQYILEQRTLERDNKAAFIELGGLEFEYTNGRYSWSYGLKCSDFHIFFLGLTNKCDNVYPIYIELSQQYLWLYGYRKAYGRLMDWLRDDCKLRIVQTKVSRADLCVHTDAPILKEDYLGYIYYDPRCEVGTISDLEFTLADLNNINSGRFDIFKRAQQGYTGIRVGKGKPLMARVYNKTLEIKNSKKEWFNSIWESCGIDKNAVVNVEYEIKRAWFNERGIDTVEDFFANIGDIWLFLTSNYLSFRNKDNSRRSRRTICAWWQDIRDETFAYDGSIVARRAAMEIDINKAMDGLLGYAVSYAAATDRECFTPAMFGELYEYSLKRDEKFKMDNKTPIAERIKRKKYRGFIGLASKDNLFLDDYKMVKARDYGEHINQVERSYIRSW